MDRFLKHSGKILYEDLDWEEARHAGLTENERFILSYFSDIESQTILYMRDLLNTRGSLDSEVLAFLTMWNYEEFFHGHALAKLLEACGSSLGESRIGEVREKALITEKLKALGAMLFSKIYPEAFLALYMTWGAINELTTLRGYEEIEQRTHNPILKILCERIEKQERRHFAWYYNNAEERLKKSVPIQRTVRKILKFAWSPVGAGVKSDSDVRKLFTVLFPNGRDHQISQEVDEKISSLPGLENLSLMQAFRLKLLTDESPARLQEGETPAPTSALSL